MRVLLVSDLPEAGGAEAYTRWLGEGFRAAGDEIRLLTSSAGPSRATPADFVAFGTRRPAVQTFLQIANPFAVQRVRQAIVAFLPEAVIVTQFAYHLSPAILWSLRAVPTVLSVHDYKIVCPLGSKLLPHGELCVRRAGLVCWRSGCLSFAHWLRDQPRYALIRAGVRGVDRVVACSPWVERELAANGIAAEYVRLPVPPPGTAFQRAPADHPLFVYCGRLSVEKGVALLIRAFARLRAEDPSARLRIIGEGAERSALEGLAAERAPGAVSFTGWQQPEAVERFLADAWALVAPSLWAEPFGLAALEAIVRGVPVIASRIGGFADTVEEGITGFLFPNGDAGALLECLRAIARRVVFPTRSLPVDVARRVADRHALAPHIERLRGILTEIVDRRTI